MNFGKTGAVIVGKHLPYMEHIKPHFFRFYEGAASWQGLVVDDENNPPPGSTPQIACFHQATAIGFSGF